MLLKYTDEELMTGPDDKKLQKEQARVLLCKAKEIAEQPLNVPQPPPDDDKNLLLPMGALDVSEGSD